MISFPRIHSHDLAENPFDPAWPKLAGTFKHSVTHHRIALQVVLVSVESAAENYTWLNADELKTAAIPAPHRKGLELAKRL
jgi:adenine-specific DNA glycosylase